MKKIKKICKFCKKEYFDVPKRRKVYCSFECFSKAKKNVYLCKNCGCSYITTKSRNTIFCSRKCLFLWNIGKIRPAWIGEKISIAKLAGREPTESKRIRKLAKFSKVRKQMLERDAFTCQICFEPGLDAHHIYTIREHPELAYELSNLVTLCKKCHDQKVSHRESDWVEYLKKR